MSFESIMFHINASRSDRKRDSLIPLPAGVEQINNISYGPYRKYNLLDVYRPEGKENLPFIVNIHGGGFVYGSKDIY